MKYLGMKNGPIDKNIKKEIGPKARLFQALSMDPRLPPTPITTCMMFFFLYLGEIL